MAPMTPRLTHFAINTDDVDATQAFYGSVFGWKFQEYGPPGFVQIMDESGETPMGAIQQRRQLLDDAPTFGFECTFSVDDVDVARDRILAVRQCCCPVRSPQPSGTAPTVSSAGVMTEPVEGSASITVCSWPGSTTIATVGPEPLSQAA